jgi:Superfamily II helicase
MMGRAGRAGFDETGTAIILTDKKSKTYYERITLGLDVVESNLLNNLTESLNTEISQRVISDIESGIKWLMDTFLFVRAQRNPHRYGVTRKSATEVLDMKEYLSKIYNESVHDLHQNGIIAMSGQGIIEPRIACQIMSRHLVPFSAMKLIIRLPYNSSEIQILHMLSKLEGLHFPVRRAEKVRTRLIFLC